MEKRTLVPANRRGPAIARAAALLTIIGAACAATLAGLSFPRPALAASEFVGVVPPEARDPKPWIDMAHDMLDHGKPFGALAAAARMLVFFNDLSTKEEAYRIILAVVDRGYPFPVEPLFVPGDIEPTGPTDFSNDYFLYKYILNREKGLPRWSDHYLALIDQDKTPKLQFYNALVAYSKGDFPQAITLLKKVLGGNFGDGDAPFARKVARTLARVYFDAENYDQALDIYTSFLLKLNPLTPSDWLETAWTYYHLKRYPEALGVLYNLESKAGSQDVSLEKYTIRALVYRALCALPRAEELEAQFDREYGPILTGIKHGEPLSRYPVLISLSVPENLRYQSILTSIGQLEKERKSIDRMSSERRAIASYLYSTELKVLRERLRGYQDSAYNAAASQLLTMDESMKFLKFEIARAKYDPSAVFRAADDEGPVMERNPDADEFIIHWLQPGDYWRDERGEYKGVIKSQCTP